MKTEFKKILALVDKLADGQQSEASLFNAGSELSADEKSILSDWAGKSADEVRSCLQPAFAKQLLTGNIITDNDDFLKTKFVWNLIAAGQAPMINYTHADTPYGQVIIASTSKGICFLVFFSGAKEKIAGLLEKEFPGSVVSEKADHFQEDALSFINGKPVDKISLDIKATEQQLSIWQALTNVPAGQLISYGQLAKLTHQIAPDIGVAMGDNRVAMLIPCHRVIKTNGELGQYHWGAKRKQAMIIREACAPAKI